MLMKVLGGRGGGAGRGLGRGCWFGRSQAVRDSDFHEGL